MTPGGSVSTTIGAGALRPDSPVSGSVAGLRLVRTKPYGTIAPAVTVGGADLPSARSTTGVPLSVQDAVLLSSFVWSSPGAVTDTVSVTGSPMVARFVVASMSTLTVWLAPGAIGVLNVQVSRSCAGSAVGAGPEQLPPAVGTAETSVRVGSLGTRSVTTTPVAVEGPWLVTVTT